MIEQDFPLSCRCGSVSGMLHRVSQRTNSRLACLCRFCRRFGELIETWGGARVLDQNQGFLVIQSLPGRFTITKGMDKIVCYRFSRKGLRRMTADCCKTPVANLLEQKAIPFLGVHCAFVKDDVDQEKIFPELEYVQAKGFEPLPNRAHAGASLKIALHSTKILVMGVFHSKNCFFDQEKNYIVPTQIIERQFYPSK